METSTKAWLALAGGVIAYDLLCEQGQTLSEGMDNFLEKHPKTTMLIGAVVVGHLFNVIREDVDPIHKLVSRYV